MFVYYSSHQASQPANRGLVEQCQTAFVSLLPISTPLRLRLRLRLPTGELPERRVPRPLKSWEPDDPVCDPKAATLRSSDLALRQAFMFHFVVAKLTGFGPPLGVCLHEGRIPHSECILSGQFQTCGQTVRAPERDKSTGDCGRTPTPGAF